MTPHLPATLFEFYTLPFFTRVSTRFALMHNYWDTPRSNAATDGPEFRFMDHVYWHFKSVQPIIRPDNEADRLLYGPDNSVISIPSAFKREATLTMGCAGDLIQAEDLDHSKDVLFSNVFDILFDTDISFANYEAVVAEKEVVDAAFGNASSYPTCCTFEQYLTLTQHKGKRFTVLNTANNHTLDLGIAGLERNQHLLAQDGIMNIGTPQVSEYGRANILVRKGVKIGFVSATFGLNGRKLPPGEEHRIHVARLNSKHFAPDLKLLMSQIADCKDQNCDFIIASLHWGYEFEFFPRHSQVETAHTLVEAGVDMIIGHHPHVIQPVEYYRTKRDPDRMAVIAYSLSSTTLGWFTAPHMILSLILNFELTKGVINGNSRTYISRMTPVPVFRRYFQLGDRMVMRLEKLQDFFDVAGDAIRSMRKMKGYVDLVMGSFKN